MMRTQRAGLTLVETLVALAILGVVAAAGLYATRRYLASESVQALLLRASQRHVAADLLRLEVGRAGYRHAGADVGTVRIRHGDRLTVRYLEDRLADAPFVREVSFEAGVDGEGRPSLYRRESGGYRQPVVLGVTRLRVVEWLDAAGRETAVAPAVAHGVRIALSFAWGGEHEMVIGFRRPVQTETTS